MAQVFHRYNEVTPAKVVSAYQDHEYYFCMDKMFLNLFGIRSSKDKDANTFNDLIGCLYTDESNQIILRRWDATTDPGTFYRENPLNKKGCAVLVPGQYKDCWILGLHKGQPGLIQTGRLLLYRDNNKDGKIDFIYPTESYGDGINIHRATSVENAKSLFVNKWSAGCQVIASNLSAQTLFSLCRVSNRYGYKKFTYTLFTEEQFFE